MTGEQFSALDGLRREIGPRAAVLDPLALADLEDTLSVVARRPRRRP